ncbi:MULTISPECIES: hypothetical protein [Cyanophyceae]|uniref:hypothetical protein n=1 Tax=Cyanophyceae TaxID=3028117 RepID=UPI001682675F|nr:MULTISPECIES: hypothetical protein [Cyanophyceae]MBD1916530.1 hypothetical protein [Phormidium sp. FACHB-77]MBD2032097.1 hypothetical protein [Phormidium sp. FACHB-322]MBD2052977.1 hypothetical protein [Leptolyngbya sp. FACHB-60]
MKAILTSLIVGSLMTLGLPALGSNPRIAIDSDTEALSDRAIAQGPIRVVASYTPLDYEAEEIGNNLTIQLFYNDELKLSTTDTAAMFAGIELMDLDSDGTAEVVVQTYTGGAHCCLATTTYTWQDQQFNPVYFGYLDGGGGDFKDLNDDGLMEFVTFDNAFLYSFSSYAGSYPPSVILTYENGEYRETTTQFTNYLEDTAAGMRFTVEDPEFADRSDKNGVLAGYVAQNIRLGRYREAWLFMLSHYDPTDDTGLNTYTDDGEATRAYADFPTALYAFLQDLGYLDTSGRPQPTVDRSPVVAEREQF